jgi:predicted DNA-binding protein (UPF0251 family)
LQAVWEAVILVGAEGFSYEEAAEICGCALGTVKSRVNRARHRLLALLDETPRRCSCERDPVVEPVWKPISKPSLL